MQDLAAKPHEGNERDKRLLAPQPPFSAPFIRKFWLSISFGKLRVECVSPVSTKQIGRKCSPFPINHLHPHWFGTSDAPPEVAKVNTAMHALFASVKEKK